jgi:CHAT domain-containing protein/tetratricopeptide (TPR) repeat protein
MRWLILAALVLTVLAVVGSPSSRLWVVEGWRGWRLEREAGRCAYRSTTGRVTGLAHLPPRAKSPKRSGGPSEQVVKVSVAAAKALKCTRSHDRRGRALLLKGDIRLAIEELRAAAKSGDAESLSDLAAALLAEAEELDAYDPALDAMVAARSAIAASPGLAAAHFNLALALERLGLTNEAHVEFKEAAACEQVSPWAEEARERAEALRPPDTDLAAIENFLKVSTDPIDRAKVIRANLEWARGFGEGRCLVYWANARFEGRQAEAQQTLELARSIGIILSETGDLLVRDAVTAIDVSETAGEAKALRMAAAVRTYAEGRNAHGEGNENSAVSLLGRASVALADLGSPMQYQARYYRIAALHEDARLGEALDEIKALERERLEAKGYRGLSAQLAWNGGRVLLVRGSYAEALDRFTRSHETSIASGEQDLAADFDGLASDALEFLGQSRAAWQRRSRALRASTASHRTGRKMIILLSAANLQLVAGNPARANALLEYALPLALQLKDERSVVYTFARRSVARDELRDAAGAAMDRYRGTLWLPRLSTESVCERMAAELGIAEGVAMRVSKPREAAVYFTNAIEVLGRSEQSVWLPDLYFERAHAYEAAEDVPRWRQDLLKGREVVAKWEKSSRDPEQRASIGGWREAMRLELISLELGEDNVSDAFFHIEDRQTAATTRDRLSLGEVQRALAPGAAVLELVTIREKVIAFLIRDKSARAVTLPESAVRIAAAAESMRTADDESFPAEAAKLYRLIIGPIEAQLADVTTLAVVPDHELTAIPFSALFDEKRNQYLIERMVVVHDDTASDAITLSKQAKEERSPSLLAIGADVFDHERNPGAASLPSVDGEARDVAKQARKAQLLLGERATPDAVSRKLREVGGVHYAGHIVGRGVDARLLLAGADGRESLSAGEIATMKLDHIRFVVLAACRGSGSGEPNAVVVRDMASGFLRAGVPTVVASATDVDDAAAPPTMRRLHSFLLDGGDAAGALRRTVQWDRQDGKPVPVPLSIRLLVMGGTRSLVR